MLLIMDTPKDTGKPKQKKGNRELIRWTGTAPRAPQKAGSRGAGPVKQPPPD